MNARQSAEDRSGSQGFGDPRLTSAGLLPMAPAARSLTTGRFALAWPGFLIGPWLHDAIDREGALGETLGLTVGAAGMAGFCCVFTIKEAHRLGISLLVRSRAVFGPRGAAWLHGLRLIALALIAGQWLAQLTKWASALVVVGTREAGWLLEVGADDGLLRLVLATLFAMGIPLLGRQARGVLLGGALVLGVVLVVWAGIVAQGYGEVVRATTRPVLLERLVLLVSLGLFVGLGVADEARHVVLPRTRVGRVAQRAAPLLLALAAVAAWTGVTVLLSRASVRVHGISEHALIADTAAVAGLAGGTLGLLLELSAWLLCAQSWLWAESRRRRLGLALLVVPASVLAPHLELSLLAVVLTGYVGAMLADVLLRRGRLWLEELYLYGAYGPVYGFSPVGMLAVLLGPVVAIIVSSNLAVRLGLGFMAGLVSYALLKPIESAWAARRASH